MSSPRGGAAGGGGFQMPKLKWNLYLFIALALSLGLIGRVIYNQFRYGETDYFYKKQSLKEPYGILYNDTRRSLGLAELPASWITHETSIKPGIFYKGRRREQDHFWLDQFWYPSPDNSLNQNDGHFSKEVRRTTQGLIYEQDRYRKTIDDSVYYLLDVKYNYTRVPKFGAVVSKHQYLGDDLIVESFPQEASKLDSLLTWISTK